MAAPLQFTYIDPPETPTPRYPTSLSRRPHPLPSKPDAMPSKPSGASLRGKQSMPILPSRAASGPSRQSGLPGGRPLGPSRANGPAKPNPVRPTNATKSTKTANPTIPAKSNQPAKSNNPAPAKPTGQSRPNHSSQPTSPSRPHTRPKNRNQANKAKPNAYPSPSIDVRPLPLHHFSSLADLLQEAGYADTRIVTPKGEKLRIKKTFDETDPEEIEQLYGAFGFTPRGSGSMEHRIQNITEPGIPIKSSENLLRSLALGEVQGAENHSSFKAGTSSEERWWTGSMLALGRAAKAVMEMSPPSQPPLTLEELARDVSTGVGLGLARGGEGVRKVKSNWELDRGRRSHSDWQQQEDRLPIPRNHTAPVPVEEYGFTGTTEVRSIDNSFELPAPVAVDEDAYGYCPLPEDYEAQCDDDELFAAANAYGFRESISLGSESLRSRMSSEDVDVAGIDVSLGSGASYSTMRSEIGQRILRGAVEYDDEYDSPRTLIIPLPGGDEEEEEEFTPGQGEPSLSPSPDAPGQEESEVTEGPEEPDQPVPAPHDEKKPLKYGDRATRLRQAHSVPAFTVRPQPSWFGSIRSTFLGQEYEPLPSSAPSAPAQPSVNRAPIRISPATTAAPSLITTSPVICDSASAEAEDLPAIPSAYSARPAMFGHSPYSSGSTTTSAYPNRSNARPAPTPTNTIASIALRTRKSLAALRSAVWATQDPSQPMSTEDGATPTLSPRLDWSASGEVAGWGWGERAEALGSHLPGEAPNKFAREGDLPYEPKLNTTPSAARIFSAGSIDYTKSFFYKPPTPPHASTYPTSQPRVSPSDPSGSSPRKTDTSLPSSYSATPLPLPRRQRSIKSLRAALLLPGAPPVPLIPEQYRSTISTLHPSGSQRTKTSSNDRTPPPSQLATFEDPPVLAILSPGAWEAGLPPRELVLEGEEWDARDGGSVGDWGRKKKRGKGREKRGVLG